MKGDSDTDVRTAAATPWDAIVIGAGPAGSLAARALARRELRTLLVDAKRFPRAKACGGCLNRRGLTMLEAAGLAHLVDAVESRPRYFRWHVGRQQGQFELPAMCVIDRGWFDEALAREAVRAGAVFLDGVQASVVPAETRAGYRSVLLNPSGIAVEVSARVVVCADGLARSSLRQLPEFRTIVHGRSRIGVSTVVPVSTLPLKGEINMIVGPCGYVGLAASGQQRLNVAAAVDPHALQERNISELIGVMLQTAGVELDVDWSQVAWSGTPPLTSRPAGVAAERLFVIGDASGYVEPFSGEGMATALSTGIAVAPHAERAARGWRSELAPRWQATHRSLVVDSQSTCRQLARILRQPWAATAALWICRTQPWVARRYIRKVS